MTNEQVAIYYYDQYDASGIYVIYAIYDTVVDFDKRIASYYEVYQHGECLNEGYPFYEMPSWRTVYDHYWLPYLKEVKK